MRRIHTWVLRETGKGKNEIKRVSKYLMSKMKFKKKMVGLVP